jgi:hypothetical protein
VIGSCVVGYNETSSTYRICIPTQQKTVLRRDVDLDEDVMSPSS